MMRDIWGRPLGSRFSSPFEVRRPSGRGEAAPYVRPASPGARMDVERGPRPLHPPAEEGTRERPRADEDAPRPAAAPAADAPVGGSAAGPLQSFSRSELDAEIEASKGRLAREAAREREADKQRLVAEMLPILDDLDRSIAAARADAAVKPALVDGLDLVRARIERTLLGYGFARIDSVGEKFDPARHEAIALVFVDEPSREGLVVDEVERGYRVGDKVVRPSRVRVGVLDR